MTERTATLRDRRRAETQRVIQEHAIRLFTDQGYESTTIAQVAEAAGVAPMTVYRHFQTKEDLVIVDQQHRLITERLRSGLREGPLVARIVRALSEVADILTGTASAGELSTPDESGDRAREFLLARLRLMITTPALRARHLDSQYATQRTIVEALRSDTEEVDSEFRLWAAAAVAMAALNTAVTWWAEHDGRLDLGGLVIEALAVLPDS